MSSSLILSLVEAIVAAFSKRNKVRDLILPLLEQAAVNGSLPDNTARREWVVNHLMTEQGMAESTARLLVEAGVKLAKTIKSKTDKKAAKG